MNEKTVTCKRCGNPLQFHDVRGWVHWSGGTTMYHCETCGHRAALHPAPHCCPECGSYDWHAGHVAIPDKS